jgi:hypothetical protein
MSIAANLRKIREDRVEAESQDLTREEQAARQRNLTHSPQLLGARPPSVVMAGSPSHHPAMAPIVQPRPSRSPARERPPMVDWYTELCVSRHVGPFSDLMAFEDKAPAELRRLVVVGPAGVGKSTLLNVIAGLRYMQAPKKYNFLRRWKYRSDGDPRATPGPAANPLFQASATSAKGGGLTRELSLARVRWRGGDRRDEIIVIDSPGADDLLAEGAHGAATEQARERDWYTKLKALGVIDAILVLLPCDASVRAQSCVHDSARTPVHRHAHCAQVRLID